MSKQTPKLTFQSGFNIRKCPECGGQRLTSGGLFARHWRPFPRDRELCPYKGRAAKREGGTR